MNKWILPFNNSFNSNTISSINKSKKSYQTKYIFSQQKNEGYKPNNALKIHDLKAMTSVGRYLYKPRTMELSLENIQ